MNISMSFFIENNRHIAMIFSSYFARKRCNVTSFYTFKNCTFFVEKFRQLVMILFYFDNLTNFLSRKNCAFFIEKIRQIVMVMYFYLLHLFIDPLHRNCNA